MATVTKRKWTHKGQAKEAWQVRYIDAGGTRRGKTFDRKKDADAYRVKVEGELAGGLHVAASPRTVGDLLDEYLAWQDERQRVGQVSAYRVKNQTLHVRYIRRDLGTAKLTDLTWQGFEAFGRALRKARCIRQGHVLAAGTINGIISTFGTALAYAERRGYIARNPAPLATKELGFLREERIEPFTRDEIQRLVAAIEDRDGTKRHRRTTAQMRAMIYLGAFCGLRKGEILALTWDAIDFERGAVHVRQSLTQDDHVKAPKTKTSWRSVPLPPAVAATLRAWRPFAKLDGRGLIFRTLTGKACSDSNLHRNYGRLLDQAGIESAGDRGQRHFHALRHFAGSAWLELGVPLATVSNMLGHATPATTARIYAHMIANPFDRADELAQLAASFAPAPLSLTQECRKAA